MENSEPKQSLDAKQMSDSFKSLNDGLDQILPLVHGYSESPRPTTGLMYDERMLLHRDESEDYHSERPERLTAIHDKFRDYGLVDRCHVKKARLATREEISTFHDEVMEAKMESLKESDAEKRKRTMRELEKTQDAVYFNDSTWEAAHLAAGASIDAVDEVGERS